MGILNFFGLQRKRSDKRHRFTDIDREISQTLQHRQKMRQLEKLNAMSIKDAPQKTLSEQIREIKDALSEAEDLGLIGDKEQKDSMMENLVTQFILQNMKQKPIPADVKDALSDKPSQTASTSVTDSDIEALIKLIPVKEQNMIKKGLIPKAVARASAKQLPDDVFERVWKRLNSRKTKK